MTGTVVVLGSANVDRVTRTTQLPRPGETVVGTDFVLHSGGKGANQAVAAARLGARSRLLAAIGTDPDGDFVQERITAEGIDTRFLVRSEEDPTGVAVIVVDDASENLIVVSPGANRRLPPAVIDRAIDDLASHDVLSIALEGGTEYARHALAHRPAATTIVNLSPATPDALDLIALADIVVMNEHECAVVTGTPDAADPAGIAARLRALGAATAIVTRGGEGAWLLTGLTTEAPHAEAIPTVRVDAVDTTGCGDAFIGALAARLAASAPLADAVRFALRVASVAATAQGAQTSYPYASDVPVG